MLRRKWLHFLGARKRFARNVSAKERKENRPCSICSLTTFNVPTLKTHGNPGIFSLQTKVAAREGLKVEQSFVSNSGGTKGISQARKTTAAAFEPFSPV